MAHNIYQRKDGKHSVFTVGEPAWHKLGRTLDAPLTADEAIREAGLDFDVVKVPVQCMTSNGLMTVDNQFVNVRTDDNVPLGVVGGRYTILQNRDAFRFFDSVVGEGHAMYHTAGALGKGERIWIMAKMPKDIIIKNEDKVEQYIVLTNTHDGSGVVQMYYTPVRVVCQNTLTASLRMNSNMIRLRHTITIHNRVSDAKRVLGLMMDFESQFEAVVTRMANVSITVDMADNYFADVLGGVPDTDNKKTITRFDNQKDMLLTLFDKGAGNDMQSVRHTAWTAYNAVTEYIDYHKNIRGDGDSARLQSIWFGSGAEIKERAFELATALV
jgi:phage/plasmid-like protein (TIGR03299 family)